jgi:DNA polymerase III epsilon subunit family exonuclease
MMNRQIDEVEFVIFDTETTGLSPEQGDRIVEIAAVRLKGEERIAAFATLVNTHTPVSPGAFQVNHITPEMLATAPEAKEVLPKFLDFIRGSCLCSFNAGFDLGFLNRELELNALPGLGDIVVVDILKMARKMLPGMERYALWFVAERLGIKNQQQHRALSDVELTLDVFNQLRGIFKDKGISDFSNFANLFGINR